MASPSAGTPALKYGDVNTETTSPGEVKGLIIDYLKKGIRATHPKKISHKNLEILFNELTL